MFQSVPRASDERELAFAEYTARLTRQLGLLGCALLFFATVAWWPLDPFVLPDQATADAFAALRLRAAVVEAVILAILLAAPSTPRYMFPLAATLHACLLFTFGFSLGELGGPDLGWLADATFGIVPFAFAPLPRPWRLVSTPLVGAALYAGFFVPFPDNLALPGAVGQISFGLFGIFFTVALGELLYRLLRRTYFERLALDAANTQLAALGESLSRQVAEQTAELRSLALHLDHVQEAERSRLARELHDELGQHLTAMRYTVARLSEAPVGSGATTAELVEDLGALLEGTHATIRDVVASLRPRVLAELGVVPAAEWMREHVEATFGLQCRLTVDRDVAERVGAAHPDVAFVAFRALQEATTNTARHAEATQVDLEMRVDGDRLVVSVQDDGRGLADDRPPGGFGLLGLRERVAELGGDLELKAASPRGLLLRVRIPLGLNSAPPRSDGAATP